MEEEDTLTVGVAGSDQVTTSLSSHLSQSSNYSSIISLAKTPINRKVLEQELVGYDPGKAAKIYNGFSYGFPLYYMGTRYPRDAKNLKSASSQPDIVRQKIQTEIDAGRVAGPFDQRPFPNLRVSPLGLVPKKSRFIPFDTSLIISIWGFCK